MRLAALEAVAEVLRDAGVRYLIAGGLAVNAHGYLRFTADIDLVIALDPTNVHAAFEGLARAGYRPSVPIRAEQLADASVRERWVNEKGMQVLNFFSDLHPATSVDVFVRTPFEFDREYDVALVGEVRPGLAARFVSLETLIRMKEEAGRPRDQDDMQHLRWILEDQENG